MLLIYILLLKDKLGSDTNIMISTTKKLTKNEIYTVVIAPLPLPHSIKLSEIFFFLLGILSQPFTNSALIIFKAKTRNF